MNAEAMLFIYNNESKPVKTHRLLEQSMRSDDHTSPTTRNGVHRLSSFLTCERARQKCEIEAEWFEPSTNCRRMLLRQNLCWHHECDLQVRSCRKIHCKTSNDRLARANVTLQQSMHG